MTETKIEIIDVESVHILRVRKGDTILLRMKNPLSQIAYERLKTEFEPLFEQVKDVSVAVLEESEEITVLHPERVSA